MTGIEREEVEQRRADEEWRGVVAGLEETLSEQRKRVDEWRGAVGDLQDRIDQQRSIIEDQQWKLAVATERMLRVAIGVGGLIARIERLRELLTATPEALGVPNPNPQKAATDGETILHDQPRSAD